MPLSSQKPKPTWNNSHHSRQEKPSHSFPTNVRRYNNVCRDEDPGSSPHNASGPAHPVEEPNEHGQWKEPGSAYSLLSTASMTTVNRPVCTDTCNIDSAKPRFAFEKRAESLQNLIRSSWMSASLHRSILALGGEQGVTFANPSTCDFSTSALTLYSPRISLPLGRSQHNSLPLGGLMHAQHERELQLTNSHKMFQPGVPPRENNTGLLSSRLQVPKPSSDTEPRARRPVGAQELASDRHANKTSMAWCASHLERAEMKEKVSQMEPEGRETFPNMSCFQKEPRRIDHKGQAGRRSERWYDTEWHRPQVNQERSTNHSIPRPKAGPTKQDLLSSVNQIFLSTADEEIAERFQALYRFRLLLRCFRRWCDGLRSLTKARLYERRRILSKALCALQQAVLLQRAQADTAARSQTALTLAQAFHKWKALYERRQPARLNPDSCSEGQVVALRRRLVKPSDSQPLRITYCAWRSHVQGQQIHRAAVIHHHLALLCKHWLLWRQAWSKQSSRSQQQQQVCVWREERLRRKAWTVWLYVWRKRQQTSRLHRLVLQRWHQNTQRARLRLLTHTVAQLLSIHSLSATFRRWKQAKELREATQSLCHLQDRGNLQAGFQIWRRRLRERMQARKIQEMRRRACLARYFSVWRRLFTHRTSLVLFSTKHKILAARIFFEIWRRALELRLLQKHMLFFLIFKRQQASQDTGAVQRETDLYGQVASCSVAELSARLVLQAAFDTWRESVKKQQLARWHHRVRVREKMRAELLKWHRLTQAEISDRALSFRARMARFHAPHSSGLLNCSGLDHPLDYTDPTGQQVGLKYRSHSSEPDACLELSACTLVSLPEREQHCPLQASSPLDTWQITREQEAEASGDVGIFSDPPQSCSHRCRGETVALRVLIRMMQPDLSLAFCQWRAVLHSSRQMKQQADLFTSSRRLTRLKVAFNMWRTHRELQHKALQHRERVLLSSSVTGWKRLMWWRQRERFLQQQAIHFYQTTIIKHCFSEWHTQAVSVLNSGLERVEWRVERRLLGWAFSTWTSRVRQHNSVSVFCSRTLLRRVFGGWQKCVQCQKERQAVALSFVQHRLLSSAFSQWRSCWTRQQLASSSSQHALCQSAKHMLRCWREYTHNRCRMHVHLGAFIEERERALKRRAILVWRQAAENSQRTQQFYQRALLSRCYFKWLSAFKQSRKFCCISQELQGLHVQRLQLGTFSLWKQRYLQAHSQKQCLHTVISKWKEFSHLHRAKRHQDQHLLTLSLQQWSRRLDIKRKRRETTRVAIRLWRQHVLQGREERERVQKVQKLLLAHNFTYWTQAVRMSIRSKEHHSQKQRRRLLQAWHLHTVSAQRMRYSEACFQYSTELRVMGSCFSLWRRVLIQTQTRQGVLEDLLKLHHRRVTARTFRHWRAGTTLRSAAQKVNTALLQKCYVCWTRQRDALRTANQFHAHRQKEAARLVLTSWSSWAKDAHSRDPLWTVDWTPLL